MVGTANKMPKLKQSRNSNIHTWFAESAKKQEEKRKAQTKYPWKSTPLPNTFQSSPEINERRLLVLLTIGLILVLKGGIIFLQLMQM